MNNIFATSKPVEFVPTHTDLRNWRFLGMEMEALGTRLDSAREALSRANSDWARWYWNETLNRLMLQWSSMPVMHDGEATMTRIPRWTVDYYWWDDTREIGGWDISDQLFDKLFRTNLDESWHRIRDERLMRCGCK